MASDDVKGVPGLDGVRRRPGMYVGDVGDGSGLHHLVWEVIGNVVDLHLARLATELHVDVTEDGWIVVRDDGPGFSTEIAPGDLGPALELAFTILHGGRTRAADSLPHVHLTPSMTGFGLPVVNALSSRTEVETTRDGNRWAIAFARGVVASPLRKLGPTTIEGTAIRFRPDPEIFTSVEIDLEHVREHLQRVAWLSPLLRVFFQAQRLNGRGGLRGWAEQLAGGAPEASFSTEQQVDDVHVDIALAWSGDRTPVIQSFVNMQSSLGHGTHVQGLYRAFSACARELGLESRAFRRCLEPGLIALVHVGLFDARWGNPCRSQLVSPVAGKVVAKVLRAQFVRAGRLRAFFESRSAALSQER